MEHSLRFKMNDKLFLRNPEDSVLGRNIVKQGLLLINEIGFEEFTFRKLAEKIGTTEASIYRYFENKHRLLIYLLTWYWSYLEFKVIFELNNIKDPRQRICLLIRILAEEPAEKDSHEFLPEREVYRLAIWEGSKSYLTHNITRHNEDKLFKPYKDLCARLSEVISDYNPCYPFSHSLASSVIELAHCQRFFMQNLPSLTDFKGHSADQQLLHFLENLVFSTLDQSAPKK